MTEYRLSELNLQEHELCLGLEVLGNNTYSYSINLTDNDLILFHGKIDDPSAPLPSSSDIKNAYDQFTNTQAQKVLQPKLMRNNVTTEDNSFKFVSCSAGNTCVTIPKGSNSIATVMDQTKIENMAAVDDNEFVSAIETLPVYKYNIIGQPASALRIGCLGNEWNNVFNFESKDPALQNIELMDMIGTLLVTVKNLNRRIKQLESNFIA